MGVPVIMSPSQMRAALNHTMEVEEQKNVSYSKYGIQRACQKIGAELGRDLWEEVKQAIKTAGYWDSWGNITIIEATNEELIAALPQIKQLFGEELVNRVLQESIAKE